MSFYCTNLQYQISMQVVFLCFVLYVAYKKVNSEARRYVLSLPGPQPLPIIGNFLAFRNNRDINLISELWTRTYGHRIGLYLGPINNYVLLTHPDDIKVVLSSDDLMTKSHFYKLLKPWLGSGLVSSDGNLWQRHRKVVNQAFLYKPITRYCDVFNEQSKILVDIIRNKIVDGNSEIPIYFLFARYAFATLAENVLGLQLDCQNRDDEPYTLAIKRGIASVRARMDSMWLQADVLWKLSISGQRDAKNIRFLHDFVNEIIKQTRIATQSDALETQTSITTESLQVTGKTKMLDFLLRPNWMLTNNEIQDEVNTLMVAGFDTTTSALFWTVLLLASNLNEQAKLHEELDNHLDRDRKKSISLSDVAKLKFLDCCLKESLRLYPSGSFIGRYAKKEFKLDENTTIPAGVNILISPHLTHRISKFHVNPSEFIPGRFLDVNSNKAGPYAYIPFSAGARNCVGHKYATLTAKLMLAYVFRNFIVYPVTPLENIDIELDITIKPKFDAYCKFINR